MSKPRTHDGAIEFCTVCGVKDATAGSECVVHRLPSASHRLQQMATRIQARRIADAIEARDTPIGRAVAEELGKRWQRFVR